MERKPKKQKSKNKIKILFFNKKIYYKWAIEKAAKDYANLADFSFGQNKNYFLIKARNIQPSIKDIFPDEFSNYVLSLTK